jgi:hypothetical protein
MDKYKVNARYDLWAGVWRVQQASLPGLEIEAFNSDEFTKAANRACSERSGGRDHRIEVVCDKPPLWCLSFPFSKRALVNGRLVTRAQAQAIQSRYAAAG